MVTREQTRSACQILARPFFDPAQRLREYHPTLQRAAFAFTVVVIG